MRRVQSEHTTVLHLVQKLRTPKHYRRHTTRTRARQKRHNPPPTRDSMKIGRRISRKANPALPTHQTVGATMTAASPYPQQNLINKLLGVTLNYMDVYGTREKLLVFGCELILPAAMNASMVPRIETILHFSTQDISWQTSQPLGNSPLAQGLP